MIYTLYCSHGTNETKKFVNSDARLSIMQNTKYVFDICQPINRRKTTGKKSERKCQQKSRAKIDQEKRIEFFLNFSPLSHNNSHSFVSFSTFCLFRQNETNGIESIA